MLHSVSSFGSNVIWTYVFIFFLVAKDVNIFFDELEGVNSPSKDDDSLLHHGNLTSTSDDASRLEVVGEVRT